MSTFFEKNPQRVRQWRPTRRGIVVPQVTLHTYEAPAGRSALAGATYFLTRPNHGSYHWLSDALGGTVHIAPWSGETYHSIPNNGWSAGISMMTYAAAWKSLTATERRNLINGAALGAHKFSRWCVARGLGPVPARILTRAQAMRREAGIVTHGVMDPGRRSDPGADFPWEQFLTEYRRLERGGSPNQQEDDMDAKQSKKLDEIHDSVRQGQTGKFHHGAMFAAVRDLQQRARSTGAQLTALTAAVDALAKAKGTDPKVITAAVTKSVDAALKDYTLTLGRVDDEATK